MLKNVEAEKESLKMLFSKCHLKGTYFTSVYLSAVMKHIIVYIGQQIKNLTSSVFLMSFDSSFVTTVS